MRLSISNIAWDVAGDDRVACLLQDRGIEAIDIAPTKYFPVPEAASDDDVLAVRRWWKERRIDIVGMQSLLFGTQGLNVFGDSASQQALLARLAAVCRIGRLLGATRLVFGSPRNRDRTGLDGSEAVERATRFFRQAGDQAAAEDVILCLEPNPARYGCNFMTHADETAAVVRSVGHPAIRMQLDIGALAVNGEDAALTIETCADLIGHIHVSEPDLVPLVADNGIHAVAGQAVARLLPSAPVTIETLPPREGDWFTAIGQSLSVAARHYGPHQGQAT